MATSIRDVVRIEELERRLNEADETIRSLAYKIEVELQRRKGGRPRKERKNGKDIPADRRLEG